MNKKIPLGAALAFMAIIAAATFSITVVFSMRTFNDKVYNIKEREIMYSKLSEIDRLARQNYNGVIDEAHLMDSVARGFIGGINDDYANYFDAATYALMTQSEEGKVYGIGAEFKMDDNGYILITSVYPESSAQFSGLEINDVIVKINDTDVTAENYQQSIDSISGEAGTKVNLVMRRGTEESTIDVTRRIIDVPTVFPLAFENVGYIYIKSFSDNTPDQFNREVDKLIESGVTSLIFDVRNNDGGTLTSVSRILDKILPEGNIVSATYKNGKTEVLEVSDALEIDLPMVVLTNGKTASSAELFAAAIKDYNKGRTVGSKTKGKGVMQQIYKLSDGTAMELTVAKYNPPVSPNFDKEGVKADYEVKITEDQEKLIADIQGTAEMDVTLDSQLKKAIDLALSATKNTESQEESLEVTTKTE